MKKYLLVSAALVAFGPFASAQSVSPAAPSAAMTAPMPASHVDASAPIAKKDTGHFLAMHEYFLARIKIGPIGLLFLGDSITENWGRVAPALYEESYSAYHPANFGIGGDTTQNVVFRVENGELDGITPNPKVLVFMLGTNNSGSHSADEIFAADKKIIGEIRAKLPDTKILLLAIFPRGPRKERDGSILPGDAEKRMAVIGDVNHQLATLDDGKMIRYLDIGPKFLDANGKIPLDIMPDQLHPSLAGYKIWVAAMQPLLTEMLRK